MGISLSICEESYAGPLTPPESPLGKRIRRRKVCPEEKPIPIDREILQDEFRTGGPHLTRLPFCGEIVSPDHPAGRAWDQGLSAGVKKVLESWRIQY